MRIAVSSCGARAGKTGSKRGALRSFAAPRAKLLIARHPPGFSVAGGVADRRPGAADAAAPGQAGNRPAGAHKPVSRSRQAPVGTALRGAWLPRPPFLPVRGVWLPVRWPVPAFFSPLPRPPGFLQRWAVAEPVISAPWHPRVAGWRNRSRAPLYPPICKSALPVRFARRARQAIGEGRKWRSSWPQSNWRAG